MSDCKHEWDYDTSGGPGVRWCPRCNKDDDCATSLMQAEAEVERLKDERDETTASLAALKQEYRPADELRSQLLTEMEAHAETRSEVERLREAAKHSFSLEQIREIAVKMIDECARNSTPMPRRLRGDAP